MPLTNVLCMCGSLPPITVSIIDCTHQMRDGGKKDAGFIAHYMMEFVKLYDPNKMLTDVLFFDGASNVQKGGEILEMEYPRAYALHGGEHVISLFFSDIAKTPKIKVTTSLRDCIYGHLSNISLLFQFLAPHLQGMSFVQCIWKWCPPVHLCPFHSAVVHQEPESCNWSFEGVWH